MILVLVSESKVIMVAVHSTVICFTSQLLNNYDPCLVWSLYSVDEKAGIKIQITKKTVSFIPFLFCCISTSGPWLEDNNWMWLVESSNYTYFSSTSQILVWITWICAFSKKMAHLIDLFSWITSFCTRIHVHVFYGKHNLISWCFMNPRCLNLRFLKKKRNTWWINLAGWHHSVL